ncbi:MAG: DUF3489 domain-containing protein [Pseudomonadota bacterium]
MSEVASSPLPAPRTTKIRVMLNLLVRHEGSSLEELVAATGWQPHTTRAVLTGLKKKGHPLTSTKPETGPRIYRIEAAEAGQ